MSILLDLDPGTQQVLEEAFGSNLPRAALEALVADGYRAAKFSRFHVQQLLVLPNRWAAEAWLKVHQAYLPITIDDVLADAETSRRARGA